MTDTNDLGVDITQIEAVPETEKMVPQSHVNKLVGLAKEKGREQGFEQARAEKSREYSDNTAPNSVDIEKIYSQVAQKLQAEQRAEEAKRLEQQSQAQLAQIAQNYVTKMQDGPNKYSDFKEVMKGFDAGAFPELTVLASTLNNTSGVMRELAKNPQKLFLFHQMAQLTPEKAYKELQDLESSITQNEQAKENENSTKTPAPLDRLQPSTRISVGAGASKKSVKDWARYWHEK